MRSVFGIPVVTAVILSFVLTVPATAETRSVTLGVRMYCPACVYNVERTLRSVPGVKEVTVSLRNQMAFVTYDDLVTDVSDLVAATEGIGFKTRVLSIAEAAPLATDGPRTYSLQEGEEERGVLDFLRRLWLGFTGARESTQ